MSNQYYNVTTKAGDAAIADAITNNKKLNITHIAFGDGNGSVPTPDKNRSSLVKEVHRQAVNKYQQHPTQASWITIEAIIPSSVGGFYIREIGVIADDILISNGSLPPTFKEASNDGIREYRLKFTMDIQSAEIVSLKLDDSLVYASQEWVEANYINRSEIVDNLSSSDVNKPISAAQAKALQDNKLDKIENAVSASRLQTPRTINDASFDGTENIRLQKLMFALDVAQLADVNNPSTNAGEFAIDYVWGGKTENMPDRAGAYGAYVATAEWPSSKFNAQMLYGMGDNPYITYRGNNGGIYSPWRYVAFEDSNVASASKLETPRTISYSGAATGAYRSDGSTDASCILTLANSGVIAGTYGSVLKIPAITVNSKGLVTVVAEQEIQVINDLTTGGANKILSAEQGKVLQETKLGKYDPAIGTQLPIYTTNSDNEFIQALSDHSGTWFDNGAGKYFNQFSMGFSAARTDAGFMMFGMDVMQAEFKVMSGVLRADGSIDYLKRQTLLTTEGNAATATKLQTARKISLSGAVEGAVDFDGVANVLIETKSTVAIGYEQSWIDAKGARAIGTTYTNSAGRPIMIYVETLNSSSWITATVNTLTVNNVPISFASGGNNEKGTWKSAGISIIIPDKHTYRLDSDNGMLRVWMELR